MTTRPHDHTDSASGTTNQCHSPAVVQPGVQGVPEQAPHVRQLGPKPSAQRCSTHAPPSRVRWRLPSWLRVKSAPICASSITRAGPSWHTAFTALGRGACTRAQCRREKGPAVISTSGRCRGCKGPDAGPVNPRIRSLQMSRASHAGTAAPPCVALAPSTSAAQAVAPTARPAPLTVRRSGRLLQPVCHARGCGRCP
jgi:hypothetical protein